MFGICTGYTVPCRGRPAQKLPPLKKKALTHFPTFPWQQQTLHTRGARGLQLKQGLSLRETTAEDSLRLSLISLQSLRCLFFFSSFFLILSLFCHSRHGPSQTHTHTSYLPLMLLQAHTPTSRITRVSVQALLLSHKAPTVPWSTGLLRYTWPLHTYTHTLTYTHRAHRAVKTA